jgi:transposase
METDRSGMPVGWEKARSLDPRHLSSKLYRRCGHLKDEFPLSARTYRCEVCELRMNHDLNAARNLAQFAPTASSLDRVALGAANACGEDG